MTELLIHCGIHKTGSTTIQRVLKDVRDSLIATDTNVPGLDKESAHYKVSTELGAATLGDDTPHWDELAGEIRRSETPRQLLTCETFTSVDPRLFAAKIEALPDADPKFYFYVRPHVGLVTSLYLQLVKTGATLRTAEEIGEALVKRMAVQFMDVIRGYSEVFGREAIHVREFSRSRFVSEDLISDFWDFLDFDGSILSAAKAASSTYNPTPSAELAIVLRGFSRFIAIRFGATDGNERIVPVVRTAFRILTPVFDALPTTKYRLPMEIQRSIDTTFGEARKDFAREFLERRPTDNWNSETLVASDALAVIPWNSASQGFKRLANRLSREGYLQLAQAAREYSEAIPTRQSDGVRQVDLERLALDEISIA